MGRISLPQSFQHGAIPECAGRSGGQGHRRTAVCDCTALTQVDHVSVVTVATCCRTSFAAHWVALTISKCTGPLSGLGLKGDFEESCGK